MPRTNLPRPVVHDIEQVLSINRSTCIRVYAEAETIRKRWSDENIALEDIVDALIDRGGRYNASMSLDPSEAADALLGR
ncbi:hypothetical protein [Aestuariivirga sp.]|uniref:hypothetical protein n=1 Tax=Aestuariivirga sp. TaxID=2650926 RepID=UPI00391DF472